MMIIMTILPFHIWQHGLRQFFVLETLIITKQAMLGNDSFGGHAFHALKKMHNLLKIKGFSLA